MHRNDSSGKSFELSGYPDETATEFLFKKFTTNDTISKVGMDFTVVRNVLLDKFTKKDKL